MAERIDDTGFGGIQLRQETTHFCYGIDAVLLADFAAGRQHGSYLDLGTNNGIIPLLLSVMTGAERLCGLEFQKAAAGLAERNVRDNGLENRIRIVCSDVLDIEEHFPKSSFEAVVCNPPYFRRGAGIVNAAEPLQAGKALFSDQYGAVPRQLIRVARAAFVNEQVGFPDTAVQCISINENLPLSVCGFALF